MLVEDACRFCGSHERGAAVRVVLVFADPLDAYPIIPSEDYHVCPCGHAWLEFTKRAIDSHPVVREWEWTEATIQMQDRRIKSIRKVGPTFVAQA